MEGFEEGNSLYEIGNILPDYHQDIFALGAAHDLCEPLQPLAKSWILDADTGGGIKGLRGRYPDVLLIVDPGLPALCQRQKNDDRSHRMGRSCFGRSTKIHALVDALGLPIGLKLTEGQAHDGRSAYGMLDGWGEGCILLGGRAYDSDAMRAILAARGAWACVRPMSNRNAFPRSARSSTDIAISSSASSADPNISAPSPRATTNAPTTNLSPTRLHQDMVAT